MRTFRPALLGLALLPAIACADTPQTFTASFDGAAFTSDDDSISFIPYKSTFSLSASTQGASSYPPPTTPIDRFSIVCDGFTPGETFVLDAKTFERSTCSVQLQRGTKPMGGDPDAEFTLDKDNGANRFSVTASHGKVIEGTFEFHLEDAGGKALVATGAFTAEDRQL